MRSSIKRVVRQLVPPFFLSARKAMRARMQLTFGGEEQRAMKAEYDRLNLNVPEGEICIRPGLMVKIHPESRVAFEAFCFSHPDAVAELDGFIRNTRGKRNLLDVGAMHGIFSLVFSTSDPARASVAVDASPLAFAHLLYNVHRNKLGNIMPVECALSAEPGVIRMHYEWEHAVAAGTADGGSTTVLVEKKTGDDLCASLAFAPDVIKIDVEGHEVKVLRGLHGTIANRRPIMFLEVHPGRVREEGDRLEDVGTMFADLRYRLESVTGESLAMRAISGTATDQRVVLRPD